MFRGIIESVILVENLEDRDNLVLQRIDDDWARYCLQYCGNGHYYQNATQCVKYIADRWGDGRAYAALRNWHVLKRACEFFTRFDDSVDWEKVEKTSPQWPSDKRAWYGAESSQYYIENF